jgi:phosphoribosylanthranilate isomerase
LTVGKNSPANITKLDAKPQARHDITMKNTRVKICGLSTVETLNAACQAGADYVGFVFFERSPRHISYAQARELSRVVPEGIVKVALTVDASDATLKQITTSLKPDILQLHGHETSARVAEIKQKFGLPVLKAVPIEHKSDIAAAAPYDGIADMILFDAKAPEDLKNALPGGNGISFDWKLLHNAAIKGDFMLSGGINAQNVAEAIALTNAAIVDVSSGVETSPGKKNVELIAQFIAAVKG